MTKIGVVGYSGQKFNENVAWLLLTKSLLKAISLLNIKEKEIVIVSGLTNLGIPALAYQIAKENKWSTSGIACSKAKDYPCFSCDEVKIIGSNWGDESETFLNEINVLIRVGGGNQSIKECQLAKSKGIIVIEEELPSIP